MCKYVVKRILYMLVTFFVIMSICFALLRILPLTTTQVDYKYKKTLDEIHDAWGYNKPIIIQYGIFLKRVFTKFDWGVCTSIGPYLQPVTKYIANKLPYTIIVNFGAFLIIAVVGPIAGMYTAYKKNHWQDKLISAVIVIMISIPSYIYAFYIQYFFGFKLGWFPIVMKSGNNFFSKEMLHSIVLPVIALSIASTTEIVRVTRAELTEIMTSDYMLLAKSKGLTNRQALIRHAFRNALVVVAPIILIDFEHIILGSLIIEEIFAIPGIGKVMVESLKCRDLNVFLATTMFYLFCGMMIDIVVDISYTFIDPRMHVGGDKSNEL